MFRSVVASLALVVLAGCYGPVRFESPLQVDSPNVCGPNGCPVDVCGPNGCPPPTSLAPGCSPNRPNC